MKLFNFMGKESKDEKFWKIFIKLKLKELFDWIIVPAILLSFFFVLPIYLMYKKDTIKQELKKTDTIQVGTLIYNDIVNVIMTNIYNAENTNVFTKDEFFLSGVQNYIYNYYNEKAIYDSDIFDRRKAVWKFLFNHNLRAKVVQYEEIKGERYTNIIEPNNNIYYVKRVFALIGIYIGIFLILLILYLIFKANYIIAKKIYKE